MESRPAASGRVDGAATPAPRDGIAAIVDLVLAAVVAALAFVAIAATRGFSSRRRNRRKVLLVFDTLYSLEVLRQRGGEGRITGLDLDGHFDHVWSVHPLVGADPAEPGGAPTGAPTVTQLAERHTVIEGRVQRSDKLRSLPRLNFALAQAELLIRVSRLMAKERVGIIRAWEPFYTGLVVTALGRLHRVPVELRIPGHYDNMYASVGMLAYPKLLPSHRLQQAVARFTLARADQVVVLSADNREYAIKNGAREDRTELSGNWGLIHPAHLVDPSMRAPVADFGLGDRPFVVNVSRLEPVKYPEDMLIALAKARVDVPDLGGLLIGDGSMRKELESLVLELGLEGHLVMISNLDQLGISLAFASAAVVLAPMGGLTLTEAALGGRPIVAYDYEWHAELIEPDETGLLVAHRDTDGMAAATLALLADPDKALRLGTAARERALEQMDREGVLAHERALADRLLNQTC